MKKVTISTTKRGYAAMWEEGGGLSNTGHATIITGRNGEARRPVHIRTRGSLACSHHALITVHEGYYIVQASHHRGDFCITVSKIVKIEVKDIDGEKFEATAEVEVVNSYSNGEWAKLLDEKLIPAVEAARAKAGSYHCRSSYYIDCSDKPQATDEEKKKKETEMREQDAKREAMRKAKAEREAKEKAEAEEQSRLAKANGLGEKVEALGKRLEAVEQKAPVLAEVSFEWQWRTYYYTAQNVEAVERQVTNFEAQRAEQKEKQRMKELFAPQFELYLPRVQAVGKTLAFYDDQVFMDHAYCSYWKYSEQGLAEFEKWLEHLEAEKAKELEEAQKKERYLRLKEQGEAEGLPKNVEIWKRTGGKTGAGNGWVIDAQGVERPCDTMTNPNPRRLSRYGEGFMVWEQILPGEVVLQWAKSCSAAPHEFTVVHLPPEGLSEKQIKLIAMIQEDIENEWKGACGLASGIPSPPVGDGWGLVPKGFGEAPKNGWKVDDLKAKFNRR